MMNNSVQVFFITHELVGSCCEGESTYKKVRKMTCKFFFLLGAHEQWNLFDAAV